MDASEIQSLIRQEVQNALTGLVNPGESADTRLNTIYEMELNRQAEQIKALEARLAGVEEDAWHDADQGDVNGIGTQHLPPLCPMPQGGLDVTFREYKIQSKNSSNTWTLRTVGGGAATSLTASATNYCWLHLDFTRQTIGNIYQWGISDAQVSITTSAGTPATGESNTVSSNTDNETAILFATITTGTNTITGVEYHPFKLHQNQEVALSITPLTESSSLDELIAGTATGQVLWWDHAVGQKKWKLSDPPGGANAIPYWDGSKMTFTSATSTVGAFPSIQSGGDVDYENTNNCTT